MVDTHVAKLTCMCIDIYKLCHVLPCILVNEWAIEILLQQLNANS